jgi:hypothetical protein
MRLLRLCSTSISQGRGSIAAAMRRVPSRLFGLGATEGGGGGGDGGIAAATAAKHSPMLQRVDMRSPPTTLTDGNMPWILVSEGYEEKMG